MDSDTRLRTLIREKLASSDQNVRAEMAQNMNFTPNASQVEAGLTDNEWSIRTLWTLRDDYTPTLEQSDRGLSDPSPIVRLAWVGNLNYVMTCEQIDKCLSDSMFVIREAMSRRPCAINEDQIKKMIEDPHIEVVAAWRQRLRNDVSDCMRSDSDVVYSI